MKLHWRNSNGIHICNLLIDHLSLRQNSLDIKTKERERGRKQRHTSEPTNQHAHTRAHTAVRVQTNLLNCLFSIFALENEWNILPFGKSNLWNYVTHLFLSFSVRLRVYFELFFVQQFLIRFVVIVIKKCFGLYTSKWEKKKLPSFPEVFAHSIWANKMKPECRKVSQKCGQ